MTDDGHWIKTAGSTYAPGCIISVIVDTQSIDRASAMGVHRTTMRCAHVVESHRRGPHWSSPQYRCFFAGDDLFTWLESTCSPRYRTYIFSPSAIDDLTLLDWHARIERIGCVLTEGSRGGSPSVSAPVQTVGPGQVGSIVMDGSSRAPDHIYSISAYIAGINACIMRFRRLGRTFQWCSHSQYCQSSEDEVARHIGYQWTASDADVNQRGNEYHSGMERAHMWCAFYRALSDWWIDIDGGPWGSTVASMSYSFLRRRIEPRSILRHDNETAGILEEQAIFGGRRAVWYVGNIGSQEKWDHYGIAAPARSSYGEIDRDIVHHDVRSMYPYLLSRMQYPIRLIETVPSMSVPDCIDAIETRGVIASVIVRTDTPEYSVRTPMGIQYPIGQFRTTLCGPELTRALSRDEIVRIDRSAIYMMGAPFAKSCEELMSMREAARDKREIAWELFTKMLANSMSGKIAQKQYQWQPRHDVVPLQEWGPWHERDAGTDAMRWYVSRAGMVWERTLASSCIRDMSAAYAYLTAYGRYYMSLVRSMIPARTAIAQDTDGIWCLDAASSSLYHDGVIDRRRGGDIRWTQLSPVGRFYGPQHYWAGHTWVISGSNVVGHRPRSDKIIVRTRHNLALSSPVTPRAELMEKIIEREVSRIHVDGDIDEHGWVTPLTRYVSADDD